MATVKGKRRILHKLKLTEISAVDRPCQEGASVSIMKRHDERAEKFDPHQPRDEDGKWTDVGAAEAKQPKKKRSRLRRAVRLAAGVALTGAALGVGAGLGVYGAAHAGMRRWAREERKPSPAWSQPRPRAATRQPSRLELLRMGLAAYQAITRLGKFDPQRRDQQNALSELMKHDAEVTRRRERIQQRQEQREEREMDYFDELAKGFRAEGLSPTAACRAARKADPQSFECWQAEWDHDALPLRSDLPVEKAAPPAGVAEFEGIVDAIMEDTGVTRTQALRSARRLYPDEFHKYQQA